MNTFFLAVCKNNFTLRKSVLKYILNPQSILKYVAYRYTNSLNVNVYRDECQAINKCKTLTQVLNEKKIFQVI